MNPAFKLAWRLLTMLGGAWTLLLVGVAAPWSSGHPILFGLIACIAFVGVGCTLWGVATAFSRNQRQLYAPLIGGVFLLFLGVSSFVGAQRNTPSLAFVLSFFLLTVTAPAFIIVDCALELRQHKKLARSKRPTS